MNAQAPAARGTHVALLLAAGGSTRLGRPKQLLRRDGETLVHRAARLLLETRPRELVVVLGAHREAVEAALGDLSHRAVGNEAWREGIGSSLRAAAAAIDAPRVLIALCDQPRLTSEHLSTLLATGACAATSYDGRPGVPAVVDAAAWSRARTAANDSGLRAMLAARDDVAGCEFPELRFDLDTPDDVEHAIREGWLDPEP